jgi:hypothetical protein
MEWILEAGAARVEEALEHPQAIAEELVHTYGGNVSQYDHTNPHTFPWLRPSLSASP